VGDRDVVAGGRSLAGADAALAVVACSGARSRRGVGPALARCAALGLTLAPVAAQALTVPDDVRAIFADVCTGCHGAVDPEAGLDLTRLPERPLAAALRVLIEVRDRVQAHVMPPPGYGEVTADDERRLTKWIEASVDARSRGLAVALAPARVRRLTRAQYERAVADLFGVAVPAAAEFPAEDLALGFDTMADALSFSAMHVEKYLAAAEQVASAVLDEHAAPAGSRWWLGTDLDAAPDAERLAEVLAPLLERAWRAPIATADFDGLLRLADGALAARQPWRRVLRLVLVAALASPRFVLRLEAEDAGPRERRYQLATRLAFLFWGSLPDAQLLCHARDGSLDVDATFVAEVRRLLRDARAFALATDFAAQWLELRNLAAMSFDPTRFDEVSAELLHAMRRETELLFEAVMREKRPVRDLLLADFTFLDRRLAAHYGVPGRFDDELRRVLVTDPCRQGLLGQASILALTSNPTRTSPVKRGKWILDNLLGAPPAPPPPGSGAFANDAVLDDAKSLREQMAAHRRQETCATCHARMDALGLALEQFDAVGRLRTHDAGGAVDSSAVLPGGRRVRDSVELRRLLAADGAFVRCLVRKLFVFAVGREPGAAELVQLDAAVRALPADADFEALLLVVVRSPTFRGR